MKNDIENDLIIGDYLAQQRINLANDSRLLSFLEFEETEK